MDIYMFCVRETHLSGVLLAASREAAVVGRGKPRRSGLDSLKRSQKSEEAPWPAVGRRGASCWKSWKRDTRGGVAAVASRGAPRRTGPVLPSGGRELHCFEGGPQIMRFNYLWGSFLVSGVLWMCYLRLV